MIPPLAWITLATAAAAGAVTLLPPEQRAPAWIVLALVYLAIGAWGVTSLRANLFGRALISGNPISDQVALTFDDGPEPRATPALLDLLAARGVSATFFCVGERARANPALVQRLAAEGHQVENHSDRHGLATNFYPGFLLRPELERCQATLTELTGQAPRYYRPPMGLANHALFPTARALDLTVVGWQCRGLDTPNADPDAVIARVLAQVRPGGVILLHDGGRDPERLTQIVSGLLDRLAARGLVPVRLEALVTDSPQAPVAS